MKQKPTRMLTPKEIGEHFAKVTAAFWLGSEEGREYQATDGGEEGGNVGRALVAIILRSQLSRWVFQSKGKAGARATQDLIGAFCEVLGSLPEDEYERFEEIYLKSPLGNEPINQ